MGGDRNLHVRITNEAYEALCSFAEDNGFTVTAVFEAVGLILSEGYKPPKAFYALARQITFNRHSRRRD